MLISGKILAQPVLSSLKKEVLELIEKGITPTIAIITVGSEDAWFAYVQQKLKRAKYLGISAQLTNLAGETEAKLLKTIKQLNNDNNVHGIIVQRPLPKSFNREKVVLAINPEKDIDGFRNDSKFESPIWLATQHILGYVFIRLHLDKGVTFTKWLRKRRIVVIGKGETGGRPVISELKRIGVKPSVIDSKTSTQTKHKSLKNTDIIISAVGKYRVVEAKNLKNGVILIGIGIHKKNGVLVGDYDEKEIESIAACYTPTPGGVGPLNLAYLFRNLVEASKLQNSSTNK